MSYPKKLVTRNFDIGQLLSVVESELDKGFASYCINCDEVATKNDLIAETMMSERKNILILLGEGNYLRTIFKNKYHRSIYFEITIDGDSALISKCFYCDKRAKCKYITPYGLKSIRAKYSKENILKLVNTELEGGFSDVVISYDYTLELSEPICGSV